MRIKNFLIGAACGVAVGFLAQSYVSTKIPYSSERVLNKVKQSLEENGKIIGSWIMTQPETIERNTVTYQAYRGGITRVDQDGNSSNFEFIADSNSGIILDIHKI